MNKEVNFEIAKLLKEKGFNLLKRPIFYKEGKSMQQGSYMYDNDGNLSLISMPEIALNKGFVDCPTIAEVVMWLYEKHGVWIGVTKYKDHGDDVNDPYYFTPDNGRHIYKTPTEAYEARIKFTLENLI